MSGATVEPPRAPTSGRALEDDGLRRLLARLDADPERAADGYERLRQRLIGYFTFNGCVEAEDLADETIDRVCARMQQGEWIERIGAYAHRTASLLLLEAQRRRQRERRAFAGLLLRRPDDSQAALEVQARCVDACLDRLAPSERELVLAYYRRDGQAKIDGRKLLADRLGINADALRLRVLRLRRKLEACLRLCLSAPPPGGRRPHGRRLD
jgi:DNA-directed RNA polymerase specialized sigma24 family protein